jgi:hypothetical protein
MAKLGIAGHSRSGSAGGPQLRKSGGSNPRKSCKGDGYLIGVGSSMKENRRSDLVLFDAQDPSSPVARVKMPFKVVSQIHGFWASADQLPPQTASGSAILTNIPRVMIAEPVSRAKERFPASWKRPVYNPQSGEIVGSFAGGATTHRV